MQLSTRGLHHSGFQALSHSGWDLTDLPSPRTLDKGLLFSLIGCSSGPTPPFTSLRYTTVLEKPTLKHGSLRTRGPKQRSPRGMQDPPTPSHSRAEFRGGPQTEQDKKRSVNVKEIQKPINQPSKNNNKKHNRPIQRTVKPWGNQKAQTILQQNPRTFPLLTTIQDPGW